MPYAQDPKRCAAKSGSTVKIFDKSDWAEPIGAARFSVGGIGRDSFAQRSDSDLAQLALIQAALARREPWLERVLASAFTWLLEIWGAMHEDLHQNRACRSQSAPNSSGSYAGCQPPPSALNDAIAARAASASA